MKGIYTYSRGNLDTQASDLNLFTAGKEGLIFTAESRLGVDLKLKSGFDNSVVTYTGSIVGSGLGYGDSLLANGTGSLVVTFWGSLETTARIVNTSDLEVIVGSLVRFGNNGTVGTNTVTTDVGGSWVLPGLYSDHTYSINNGIVTW